jgi:drug/metabolite transporter (DMT)-like permease
MDPPALPASRKMTAGLKYRIMLLGAACLFSTGGAAIKAASLSGWQVASFRSGVAALALLALLPEARKGWGPRVLPAALAYACTLVLFVHSTKLTTAANAIFLQSTAPIYLLLLGPVLLAERIRKSDLLFITVLAFGMGLFFVGTETAATAPDPRRGNVYAAFSGVAWALTIASLRWLGKRAGSGASPMAAVVTGNSLAFLAALPMALPVERIGVGDALVLVYLGVVQVGLAYVFMTRALRHIPAFEAGALILIEPVLNPIWAWLVHGERPGNWAAAGGAVILLATLANTWRQSRARMP